MQYTEILKRNYFIIFICTFWAKLMIFGIFGKNTSERNLRKKLFLYFHCPKVILLNGFQCIGCVEVKEKESQKTANKQNMEKQSA